MDYSINLGVGNLLKNIIRLTPEPFLDLVKKIYYPLIGKKYLLF